VYFNAWRNNNEIVEQGTRRRNQFVITDPLFVIFHTTTHRLKAEISLLLLYQSLAKDKRDHKTPWSSGHHHLSI